MAEKSAFQELQDKFTLDIPGARFMPAYRFGWDGKIRLLERNGLIYKGLFKEILRFAQSRGYEISYPPSLDPLEFSIQDALDAIGKLTTLTKTPRDYQVEAMVEVIKNSRLLLISPTASGKSLIIYLLFRFYNLKTLLIVPTTSLVDQMADDFLEYGYGFPVHKIFSGQEKDTQEACTISTWQSIYKLPKEWFDKYEMVIVDEAHLAKASSLKMIMEKLTDCAIRIGTTGTLDGTNTNEMVLTGLFGPKFQVTTTAELIEKKTLAKTKIVSICFKYPKEQRAWLAKSIAQIDDKRNKYKAEVEYLENHPGRNRFIRNLACKAEGNTLLLFGHVAYGKEIYQEIKAKTDRPVYLVYGKVSGEERNEIRKIVEKEKEAIIIASFKTFSTGINITSLNNIILSLVGKAKINLLQSIGRGLRKNETKNSVTIYDLGDDLSHGKRKSFSLVHMVERLKIYAEEKHKFKIHNVEIT